MIDDRRRAVLSIAVPMFGADELDDEAPVGGFRSLPFAVPLSELVVEQLRRFGYVEQVAPSHPSAEQLGASVKQVLRTGPNDIVIVHVVSHGYVDRVTRKLRVVGADGLHVGDSEIERWLTDLEGSGAGGGGIPQTLFLLDLCYSGAAARLDWQGNVADEDRRAWVLAASEQDAPAYSGRFSAAVAEVLKQVADGGLDIAASVQYVPLSTVATEIAKAVNRLSEGRLPQRVTTTLVSLTEFPEPQFFPNVAFDPRAARLHLQRTNMDEGVRPFIDDLDELLDWQHFASRAAGGGGAADLTGPGAFRGRGSQLRQITDFLDGDHPPGVLVVTGSPGAGKSALLGMVVCAAHPQLAEVTQPVWRDRRDDLPAVNGALVAVHARQRRPAEILASLARQLGLPDPSVDAADLVQMLAKRRPSPVVLVDALDEAIEPGPLVEQLLLPLAKACRLVVGMRPWTQYEALRQQAFATDWLIDLDTVPADELNYDLVQYIDDRLRDRYPTAAARPIRNVIAETAAAELTAERAADGGPRWGEFLVATLFTHHLAQLAPFTHAEAARAVAAAVPRTLPEIFELDLAIRQHSIPWLRPALAALAFSFGAGMPRSIIQACAETLQATAAPVVPPTATDISEALDAARFYLRHDVDEDGTTLYRLFHQGLADYLRDRPMDVAEPAEERIYESVVLNALLNHIGHLASQDGSWVNAEPYIRNYAANHAAASGRFDELLSSAAFLVCGHPFSITRCLNQISMPIARDVSAVYRLSFDRHYAAALEDCRSILSVDAMRMRNADLASRLINVPGLPPMIWRPRWASNAQVSYALRRVLVGHRGTVSSVAWGLLDDRPIAITGSHDGTARVWDLTTGDTIISLTGHTGWVVSVAYGVLDGHPIAITGSHDGTARVWDLTTGDTITTFSDHTNYVISVAYGVLDGHPIAITGSRDHTAQVRDLTTGDTITTFTNHTSYVLSIAYGELNGHPIAITSSHRDPVQVWDPGTGETLLSLVGDFDLVTPVACTAFDGHPIGITGSEGGSARIWDLGTGETLINLIGHTLAVTSVAGGVLDGRPIAITGNNDRTARVWDLTTGDTITSLTGHTGFVESVAHGVLDDCPIAITGSADRTARVWDLRTSNNATTMAGHSGSISSIAHGRLNGRPIAITGSRDRTARVWDLGTGEILTTLAGHTGWVSVAYGDLDGRPIAITGSWSDPVRVWDLANGDTIAVMGDDHSPSVAYGTVDERPIVITGSNDGIARIWDLGTGEIITNLIGHDRGIVSVAHGVLDGCPIAITGSADRTARVWNLRTGDTINTLSGLYPNMDSVADFGVLDGCPIAITSSYLAPARVWDMGTGEIIATFTGHTSTITSLAHGVVGDRSIVITSHRNGPLLVWDLATRAALGRIAVPAEPEAVSLTDDGEIIVGFEWEIAVFEVNRLTTEAK